MGGLGLYARNVKSVHYFYVSRGAKYVFKLLWEGEYYSVRILNPLKIIGRSLTLTMRLNANNTYGWPQQYIFTQ